MLAYIKVGDKDEFRPGRIAILVADRLGSYCNVVEIVSISYMLGNGKGVKKRRLCFKKAGAYCRKLAKA